MEQMEKNTTILEWIIKAKKCYLNNYWLHGMCNAFSKAILYPPDFEANLISILQEMDHPLYKF